MPRNASEIVSGPPALISIGSDFRSIVRPYKRPRGGVVIKLGLSTLSVVEKFWWKNNERNGSKKLRYETNLSTVNARFCVVWTVFRWTAKLCLFPKRKPERLSSFSIQFLRDGILAFLLSSHIHPRLFRCDIWFVIALDRLNVKTSAVHLFGIPLNKTVLRLSQLWKFSTEKEVKLLLC